MRYDEMQRIYPAIEDVFSQVAGYVHSAAGSELAMGWAQRWIARYVDPKHREAVTAKIRQFIDAIKGG